MVAGRVAVVVLALVATARADGTLDEARRAVDEVRYDEAQRLLVAALHGGGHAPAVVRELYRLSASTAVVLGQLDVGEQYYRRWLAIDPGATLGDDVAPKLREPFSAAQAFIAANGRVDAELAWSADGELEVVVAQPMRMVVAVGVVGGERVGLPASGRAVMPATAAGTLALLDEHGNHLLELAIPAAAAAALERPAPPPDELAPVSRTYLAWGAVSLVFLAGAGAFGYLASEDQRTLDEQVEASTQHYYADAVATRDSMRRFTYLAIGSGVVGVALAIPAIALYARTPAQQRMIPFVQPGGGGVALVGRF